MKLVSHSLIFLLGLLIWSSCDAQIPKGKPRCENATFEKKVAKMLRYSVPLKGVKELAQEDLGEYLILDARPQEEYEVSHIQGAKCVGFRDFDIKKLKDVDRRQPVVVYCSVGYRSEKIGEQLQAAGFTKVYNLYGSLFEWVNQGHPVYNLKGKTNRIHTYNEKWSQWVFNKEYKKMW